MIEPRAVLRRIIERAELASASGIYIGRRASRGSVSISPIQIFFFNVDGAFWDVDETAGKNVPELAADFALHLVSLATIICRDHHVEQMPLLLRDGLANLDNIAAKSHPTYRVQNPRFAALCDSAWRRPTLRRARLVSAIDAQAAWPRKIQALALLFADTARLMRRRPLLLAS